MAHTKSSRRRRVPGRVLGYSLVSIFALLMCMSLPATAGGPAAAESGRHGVDQEELADTGAAQNQLLILGAAMVLAGGIAAYAVSRHRDAGHH